MKRHHILQRKKMINDLPQSHLIRLMAPPQDSFQEYGSIRLSCGISHAGSPLQKHRGKLKRKDIPLAKFN